MDKNYLRKRIQEFDHAVSNMETADDLFPFIKFITEVIHNDYGVFKEIDYVMCQFNYLTFNKLSMIALLTTTFMFSPNIKSWSAVRDKMIIILSLRGTSTYEIETLFRGLLDPNYHRFWNDNWKKNITHTWNCNK